jgi:hypothetical protein
MWSAAFKVVAELCLRRIEGCSSSVALIKARSLQQRKNMITWGPYRRAVGSNYGP